MLEYNMKFTDLLNSAEALIQDNLQAAVLDGIGLVIGGFVTYYIIIGMLCLIGVICYESYKEYGFIDPLCKTWSAMIILSILWPVTLVIWIYDWYTHG